MPKVIDRITIEVSERRIFPESEPSTVYGVRRGDRWEEELTKGEALEVIARWLFSPADAGLPYLRDAAAHEAYRRRHGHYDDAGNFVPPTENQEPAEAGEEMR